MQHAYLAYISYNFEDFAVFLELNTSDTRQSFDTHM